MYKKAICSFYGTKVMTAFHFLVLLPTYRNSAEIESQIAVGIQTQVAMYVKVSARALDYLSACDTSIPGHDCRGICKGARVTKVWRHVYNNMALTM